jgi:hypothetical protein
MLERWRGRRGHAQRPCLFFSEITIIGIWVLHQGTILRRGAAIRQLSADKLDRLDLLVEARSGRASCHFPTPAMQ